MSDRIPDVHRTFCRVAAFVFFAVVVYTLLTKGLDGRISRDWLHTVLHVGSGIAAVYAGWIRTPHLVTPQAYTIALGATYLVLGIVGWFVNGLFLGAAYQIPLGAADNVFHDLLAAGAGYTVVRSELPRWGAHTP